MCLFCHTWHNLGHSSHPPTNHATCVTWVHVVGDFCHITCPSQAVLRHPTLDASKNVKFRLSQNSTKFDMVARFRETIPTVKPFRHPRSRKFLGFSRNYRFTLFQKIRIFPGLTFSPPLKEFHPEILYNHNESHAYATYTIPCM